MLHFIRERAQGWVAWFIVGLISIPFALWGVNSYLNGPSDIVVATVNGESVKQTEYKQALQQYRDRMRTVMKDKFDPKLFDSMTVKQSVLNELIEKKLLFSAGHDLGQRINDASLNSIIQATPAFQKAGKFDPDRYSMMLRRIGLNPERYEAELRRDSITQQLTRNVQQSTLVGQYAVDDILRLEKQKREIAYGVIPASSLVDKITVNDDSVKTYYQQHLSNYLAPERVSINYIELSVDKLTKNVSVNDDDLRSFYANNQDLFVGPEQRRASHILIEGDKDKALATIDKIKSRLDQGEDFSTLAKEYSQDAGSAKEGGDLGYFQHNVMDPAFEKAVFAMKNTGDITGPIKTQFGYHLIKLTGIKAAEGKSFADAKSDVERLYRRKKAEDIFYDKADKLADISYENPDSLDATAEALGLDINTVPEFTRNGGNDGIAKNKKVISAAFSEDVLVNDLNSAVIELSKSDLVVLHKKKHIPASQLPLKSVAPAIKEQLRFEQATAQAKQDGMAIVKQLKAGSSADSLFSADNWHAAKFYDRTDTEVSQQILRHAFSTAKPSKTPEYSAFTASNGNYIVLKIVAVKEGDIKDTSNEEREGLKAHLQRTYGASEIQAFINALKQKADIEIFKQYL